MNRGAHIIIWVLIVGILAAGCSYTSVIDPSSPDRSELYEGEIVSVMMTDSTESLFQVPPTVFSAMSKVPRSHAMTSFTTGHAFACILHCSSCIFPVTEVHVQSIALFYLSY